MVKKSPKKETIKISKKKSSNSKKNNILKENKKKDLNKNSVKNSFNSKNLKENRNNSLNKKKKKFLFILNHKVLSFTIIIIILISSLFYLIYLYNKDLSSLNFGSEKDLLVLYDKNCNVCQVDPFITQVKNNLIENLTYAKIDINSNEAIFYLNQLDVNFSPIYLFSSDLDKREDWQRVKGAFILVNLSGNLYYLLDQEFMPVKKLLNEIILPENLISYNFFDKSDMSKNSLQIISFIDYESPYVAITFGNEKLLRDFQNQYIGFQPPLPSLFQKVKNSSDLELIFVNSPISSNTNIIHLGAICAFEQSLWEEYNSIIIENRDLWLPSIKREEIILDLISSTNLNQNSFLECIHSDETKNKLQKEIDFTNSLNIKNIPSFLIGDFYLSGIQNYAVFETILDLEFGE